MRLYIHIGSGKTGSTTIQAWCRKNRVELEKYSARYLGLYFEETPHYSPIKDINAHQKFFRDLRSNKGEAATNLRKVFPLIVKDAQADGIDTLIWSNEALFSAYNELGEAIAEISNYVPVTLVAYIRRQESWLMSAYQQWGIKHKTVRGRVPDFGSWVKEWIAECDYTAIFSAWEKYVGRENITIGIVERTDNMVSDFCDRCGLEIDLSDQNDVSTNVRLRNTQASLYKLYNDCFPEPKQQAEMQSFISRTGLGSKVFDDADSSLGYPDWDTLEKVAAHFTAGNETLARYAREGEDLSFPDLKKQNPPDNEISNDALISALLMSLVNCESRIAHLEHTLASLQAE